MLAGLSGISSSRYDLRGRGPFKQAYVISSSYRSGSTYLCTCLWRTGLLGAPFEYFNYEHEMPFMQSRLSATSADDYVNKLIACRISDNGVFGFKAHFRHFRAALRHFPGMLSRLAPLQFVFIRRSDKIAQAVSLAKAYQTRTWLSLRSRDQVPLFYSRDFITACLQEIQGQEHEWINWFDSHGIAPYTVYYEDLVHDERRVTTDICCLLHVDSDEAAVAEVPQITSQSDEVNAEWLRRFKSGC
jgi:trehalose 2-sulfotransferase